MKLQFIKQNLYVGKNTMIEEDFVGSLVFACDDNHEFSLAIGSDGAFDTIQYLDVQVEILRRRVRWS